MNLNDKLFFKINSLVGRNRWADAFARAGAEWVILAMVGWYITISFILNFGNRQAVWLPIVLVLIVGFVGWIISFIIGKILKKVRPRLRFPEIKILFLPLYNWKSFPSDHAFGSFLLFFFALIFNFPTAWSLLILALWVSWGRVYSGLHDPIDILGGLSLAGLLSLISYYILHFYHFL